MIVIVNDNQYPLKMVLKFIDVQKRRTEIEILQKIV
jgi:hypothetical protein